MDPTFPQERVFAALHSDFMRECYRKGFLAGQQVERVRKFQQPAERVPTLEYPDPTDIQAGDPKLIIEQAAEEG